MKRLKGERIGGRQKGTPNAVTAEQRQWLNKFLTDQRADFVECYEVMAPEKRCQLYLKAMEYILPRPQSITIDTEIKQLEALLQQAPDQFIEKIADKIYELNKQANES